MISAGPISAQYGRPRGSAEIKSSADLSVLAPEGFDSVSGGFNSGFFVRPYLAIQLLIQMDAVSFSAVHSKYPSFGRRAFEVAPGMRWWVVPEWRLCPFLETYLSIPMVFRKDSKKNNELVLNQGIRYGAGLAFDWTDGYGFSTAANLIHLFQNRFETFVEWSLSILVVF